MIQKTSKRLTSFFVRKNCIENDEREIYDYCFEIMLSTILNLLGIFIIGFVTANYIQTLIFTVVFMTMRGVGGGYHAKTHLGCISSLVMIFVAYLMVVNMNYSVMNYIGISMIASSNIISLIFAPVECANKKINTSDGQKKKIENIILLIILDSIYAILYCFERTREYAFCIALITILVSTLYVIGFINNRITKEVNEYERKE